MLISTEHGFESVVYLIKIGGGPILDSQKENLFLGLKLRKQMFWIIILLLNLK